MEDRSETKQEEARENEEKAARNLKIRVTVFTEIEKEDNQIPIIRCTLENWTFQFRSNS